MEKKLYSVNLQIEANSQGEADLKLEKMLAELAKITNRAETEWRNLLIQGGIIALNYLLKTNKPIEIHKSKPKGKRHLHHRTLK